MGDVKVCRICLIMDVKMYNLKAYHLETYFEAITGNHPINIVGLPQFLCYECAALVRKFYFFRERCFKGQATLYGILHVNGKITEEEVKEMHRDNTYLTSNLTKHLITENMAFVLHENDESREQKIKDEPSEDCTDVFKIIYDDDMTQDLKEECRNDLVEKLSDDPSVYKDIPSSSDDDEPLSIHKSNKETVLNRKSNGGKKKKNLYQHLREFNSLVDIPALTPILDIVEPKRKRGRPKKGVEVPRATVRVRPRKTANTGGVAPDEINLEEYVTIIKLSIEEQKEEINQRQHSSNYLNAAYKCNLCYKGFIDTHAWNHHVGKHDPSAGDIECPICKFRFKTKRTLQKHASNHEKKYACKSCSYISKTATQAKQHQRWHKGVTYKCQYCDEVSTKWTSYLSHVRMKHPSDFICDVCGYSFVSKLGLTMHKTMMHKDVVAENSETGNSEEGGPYCEQCQVKFISVEAYKRHMVTSIKHTQSKDFKNGCRVCGDTFKNSEELRLHHRKEHARKRPKNYGKKPSNAAWPAKCEHCSEEIPNAREHWAHFRRAHPDKNYPIQKDYVCDICGKSFRGNAFLVYHRRTHFEERAFKCAACGKAFHNRTNLQMHEKTHSDTRPYPCNVCFKAFKCKGALDRHFRSHTGVKPYECEVCGKAFGQSNSRKLHVRTVHLKQPAPYISRNRQERRNKLTAQKDQPPQQFMYCTRPTSL